MSETVTIVNYFRALHMEHDVATQYAFKLVEILVFVDNIVWNIIMLVTYDRFLLRLTMSWDGQFVLIDWKEYLK